MWMLVRYLQLVRMPPKRRGVGWGGVENRDLEELRWRIEELEHRRNGDANADSKHEEEVDEEWNVEERDPKTRLIS